MAGRGPVKFTGASTSSASRTVTVRVEPTLEFVITRSSDGVEIGRGMLPLVPGSLLVADSGERLVLLDAWGGGRTNKGLKIVDAQGALVAAFTLEQLFTAEVRAGFPQSVSGPMWRADTWIDDELGVVAIVSAVEVAVAVQDARFGERRSRLGRPPEAQRKQADCPRRVLHNN